MRAERPAAVMVAPLGLDLLMKIALIFRRRGVSGATSEAEAAVPFQFGGYSVDVDRRGAAQS